MGTRRKSRGFMTKRELVAHCVQLEEQLELKDKAIEHARQSLAVAVADVGKADERTFAIGAETAKRAVILLAELAPPGMRMELAKALAARLGVSLDQPL